MTDTLLGLAKRFCRDESGAFIAIFGVIAIVLVALGGAVVDYVTVEHARNRAQVALDAAALSLQPSIYTDTEAQLKAKAKALLDQQIGDANIGVVVEKATTDDEDGMLHLEARLTVPMTFVSLVGVNQMTPMVVSEATRKKLFLEVAMVLDNSGSMSNESRMTNLKAAAKNATNILMEYDDPATGGDGSVTDSTFISVVPFNFFVNIGSSHKTDWWMSGSSASSISNDNFDDDDNDATAFTSAVDRFALYDAISNVSWSGCVEARPQPYDADDTTPDVTVPDTLFVPVFAPDEPDSHPKSGWGNYNYSNSYLSDDPPACQSTRNCRWTRTYHGCKSSGNSCDWSEDDYQATYPDGTVVNGSNACSCSGETILTDSTTSPTYEGSGNYKKVRTRTCVDYYGIVDTLSERERQERLCKYTGSASLWGNDGPNGDCVSTALLPLTNTRSSIINRIDAMTSNGATNIHQGAIWGFHALSPTEPLTEGREYDTATYKVMILMTDGENTYYKNGNDTSDLNGAYYYAPYGWPVNRRLGTEANSANQMEDLVDGRLLATCTNMKDAGIDIFTIGLAPPNTDVEDMLTACASDPSQAHFPETSSELGSVFETIAQQLSDLRLSL